jgi:hypothetical protein
VATVLPTSARRPARNGTIEHQWNFLSSIDHTYLRAPSYRRTMAYMKWVGLSDDIQAAIHKTYLEELL